ncbi:MAG: hypothetical protein IPP91_15750 [Betaproteobacteria bacterium]|nr:hypothetical protein [Betaproteobacteria bacterium]
MKWLFAAFLALACAAVRAEVRAQVAGIDPATPAVLARNQPLYVRIDYADADGHHFWAKPYFRGDPVKRIKFNASSRYAGSGSALGWFSLDQADAVDEVRIVAGGGRPFKEFEVSRLRVDVRGTGVPGESAPRAEWVDSMQRESDAQRRRDMAEEKARPASVFDSLIVPGFMLAVLGLLAGGVAAPVWAIRRWQGGWRFAAALPLVAIAFVVARIVVDTARDPTSHNLWPFEILMAGGAGLAFLAVAYLVKRLAGFR